MKASGGRMTRAVGTSPCVPACAETAASREKQLIPLSRFRVLDVSDVTLLLSRVPLYRRIAKFQGGVQIEIKERKDSVFFPDLVWGKHSPRLSARLLTPGRSPDPLTFLSEKGKPKNSEQKKNETKNTLKKTR